MFSEKLTPSLKNWSTVFLLRVLWLKMQHFLTKLSCQKPMLQTNRIRSTKWTYYKERGFAPNYIFFENLLEYKKLLQIVDLMYQSTKYPYSYFSWALEFYLKEWCSDEHLSRKVRKKNQLKYLVDTRRKLNVHKTFRRCPGRLLNVLCTFNLSPVSTRVNRNLWKKKALHSLL